MRGERVSPHFSYVDNPLPSLPDLTQLHATAETEPVFWLRALRAVVERAVEVVQLLALPSRRVWLDEVCYAYKERTRKDIENEHDPAKVRCLPMCHEMYTAAC